MNSLIPKLALLILVLLAFFACASGNTTEPAIPTGKPIQEKPALLSTDQAESTNRSFYCDCEFDEESINFDSCGYKPIHDESIRSHRLEWEHVVPAEAFGRSFVEWREGHEDCVDTSGKSYKGRRCALKTSSLFKQMATDPVNLVQVIGELNARRSNFSMAMIPGEKREFGECDIELENHKIEPRPEIRGDIARIYFYMDETYPGHGIISKKNMKLFNAWSAVDRLDIVECKRWNSFGEQYVSEISSDCSKIYKYEMSLK